MHRMTFPLQGIGTADEKDRLHGGLSISASI